MTEVEIVALREFMRETILNISGAIESLELCKRRIEEHWLEPETPTYTERMKMSVATARLPCFTTFPNPEEGPVYINPKYVQAVIPDSAGFTVIVLANDRVYWVAEPIDQVVDCLEAHIVSRYIGMRGTTQKTGRQNEIRPAQPRP